MELNYVLTQSLELVSNEKFKDWTKKVLECEKGLYRGVDIEFALMIMEDLKKNCSFLAIKSEMNKRFRLYFKDNAQFIDIEKSIENFEKRVLKKIVCEYYMYKPQAKQYFDYCKVYNSESNDIFK